MIGCGLTVSLGDNKHVVAKQLARIHAPNKAKVMTKNDYKKDKFKKAPKKD